MTSSDTLPSINECGSIPRTACTDNAAHEPPLAKTRHA